MRPHFTFMLYLKFGFLYEWISKGCLPGHRVDMSPMTGVVKGYHPVHRAHINPMAKETTLLSNLISIYTFLNQGASEKHKVERKVQKIHYLIVTVTFWLRVIVAFRL